MLIMHERERLLNAVIYFRRETEGCNLPKLCNLLYLLDFWHYRETGRSVTGLVYFAEQNGPAPKDLSQLKGMIGIQFDTNHFTRRQLRIMASVAKEYRSATAIQIANDTDREDGFLGWKIAYRGEEIPYHSALLRKPTDHELRRGAEIVRQMAIEHEEMVANYG